METIRKGRNNTMPAFESFLGEAKVHVLASYVWSLSNAPSNGTAIGGIKVMSANGWFAARPSGTENIYKIYAESFQGEAHLQRVIAEAQTIVDAAITPAS